MKGLRLVGLLFCYWLVGIGRELLVKPGIVRLPVVVFSVSSPHYHVLV